MPAHMSAFRGKARVAALAATALEHGLTMVTRNVAHHERTGVAIVNPFEARSRKR
jgi:predicted nucleic acid-binding protein